MNIIRSGVLGHLAVRSFACVVAVWLASCRSGGPIFPGDQNANARGTLSGTVSGPEGSYPVARRLVEAVDLKTGRRFSTKTNVMGGYTFLLPSGTYGIRVALGRGEVIVKQPQPVEVKPGELVTGIDVTFGGAGIAKPRSLSASAGLRSSSGRARS